MLTSSCRGQLPKIGKNRSATRKNWRMFHAGAALLTIPDDHYLQEAHRSRPAARRLQRRVGAGEVDPAPSTLHLWWARRPLAAARAVIFAQMVDDPSACPEEFPTEADQKKERERLFRFP